MGINCAHTFFRILRPVSNLIQTLLSRSNKEILYSLKKKEHSLKFQFVTKSKPRISIHSFPFLSSLNRFLDSWRAPIISTSIHGELVNLRTIAIVIGHGSTKKKRPQERAHFPSLSLSLSLSLANSSHTFPRFLLGPVLVLFARSLFPLTHRPSSSYVASFAPKTYLTKDRERSTMFSSLHLSLDGETRPWQRRCPDDQGRTPTIRAVLSLPLIYFVLLSAKRVTVNFTRKLMMLGHFLSKVLRWSFYGIYGWITRGGRDAVWGMEFWGEGTIER